MAGVVTKSSLHHKGRCPHLEPWRWEAQSCIQQVLVAHLRPARHRFGPVFLQLAVQLDGRLWEPSSPEDGSGQGRGSRPPRVCDPGTAGGGQGGFHRQVMGSALQCDALWREAGLCHPGACGVTVKSQDSGVWMFVFACELNHLHEFGEAVSCEVFLCHQDNTVWLVGGESSST